MLEVTRQRTTVVLTATKLPDATVQVALPDTGQVITLTSGEMETLVRWWQSGAP